MNSFLLYILKSTICISLLYLLFRVLMRKEASFAVNRAVLLMIVAVSACVPLFHIPQPMQAPVQIRSIHESGENKVPIPKMMIAQKNESDSFVSPDETALAKRKQIISLETLLQMIYLSGVLIAFVFLLRNIGMIGSLSTGLKIEETWTKL